MPWRRLEVLFHWRFGPATWGEPRVTVDVDLTFLTGFENEATYVDRPLECFAPRRVDARDFALANRTLLLASPTGVGIDIALGGLPYEELVVERATMFEFLPNLFLRTCSAEYLIVLKAFADRFRDWNDMDGILIRQRLLD